MLNRRHFLMSSAAAIAATRLGAKEPVSPNGKLHVAVIGVAAQGAYNWGELRKIPQVEVVALCDVHETRTGPAREAFPKATFDTDFRKTLDRKGIDAVLIATPDHTHAHPTLMALRSGRHVYCEKPLTHTVQEARLVTETAKKEKRVTQMGTQIHAGANYRRVVELIQSGAIGTVGEVHCWVPTSYGGGDRPRGSEPVIEGLDWNLWLGPAPERPFFHTAGANTRGGTYLPFNWRKWWDFGGGAVTDMACHYVDLPYWALKLKYPTRVQAEGSPVHPETAAHWVIVNYEFPARGDLPPVKLTWYDGGKRPAYITDNKLNWGAGVLFVGSKGMLLSDYGKHVLLPEKQFADFKRPEKTIPDSIGHHREWVEACLKGEATTTCDFSYSGPLAETAMLGAVSYRCGKALEWDATALKASNAPEADRFIRKEYRKGWEI